MRIARFKSKDGVIRYGIVENDSIFAIEGDILGTWRKNNHSFSLKEVEFLVPIVPPNLLAIGQNYKAHIEEGKAKYPSEPPFFIKATSCINDPGGYVMLPAMAPDNVDYEGELAVIIKKTVRKVTADKALDYVLGYTCANDISARDCQTKDGQWARGKSFETFGPLGPWIETELDPSNCRICSRLNGKVMQDSNTSQMVFNVPNIISYLSFCMTILPGTVILSGTPGGCGYGRTPPVWLRPGDTVEVEIEGIGVLRNTIVKEQ